MNETTKEAERLIAASLPPDPDGENDNRSQWAEDALVAFMASTGTEKEDAVADLLADLMHYCDRHAFDFEAELAQGRQHYEAETWEGAS